MAAPPTRSNISPPTQEEAKVIAQANSEIDDKGHFIGKVTVRQDGEFLEVSASEGSLHGRLAQAGDLDRRWYDSVP